MQKTKNRFQIVYPDTFIRMNAPPNTVKEMDGWGGGKQLYNYRVRLKQITVYNIFSYFILYTALFMITFGGFYTVVGYIAFTRRNRKKKKKKMFVSHVIFTDNRAYLRP